MSRKDKKEIAAPESPVLWWLWGAGLIWALAVCLRFYQARPFSYFSILDRLFDGTIAFIPALSTALNYAVGLLFFLMLAVSAFFVGQLTLRRFDGWASSLEWFVFSTALGYGALALVQGAVLIALLFALASAAYMPMMPLADAYALRGLGNLGRAYGPVRLWGSAAFIAGSLGAGVLLDSIATRDLI